MKNNQVKFDNTVVWRDFTAKDFEEALKCYVMLNIFVNIVYNLETIWFVQTHMKSS
mgnify:CR=1 FL=1|jgi:hypothetical protein